MSLIAKNTGNGEEFKKVSEGNHIARCVRVIDLGTQSYEWNGKRHSQPKVQIAFEIPQERIDINGENLPMMLSIDYTLSLHEHAKLRAALEQWRGQPFTEEQLAGFDLRKLLGVTALITVMHSKSPKTGKTYANIVAMSPAKIGGQIMECPPAENPPIFYEIEQGTGGDYSKLPEWTQKKIQASEEFSGKVEESQGEATGEVVKDAFGNSDLPF
jgi:hypothetical protein